MTVDMVVVFLAGVAVGLMIGAYIGFRGKLGEWIATNLRDANRQHNQEVELAVTQGLDDIRGMLREISARSGNDPDEVEELGRWGRLMLRCAGFFRRRAGLSPRKDPMPDEVSRRMMGP